MNNKPTSSRWQKLASSQSVGKKKHKRCNGKSHTESRSKAGQLSHMQLNAQGGQLHPALLPPCNKTIGWEGGKVKCAAWNTLVSGHTKLPTLPSIFLTVFYWLKNPHEIAALHNYTYKWAHSRPRIKRENKFQWLPDKVSGTNWMVPDTGHFVPDIKLQGCYIFIDFSSWRCHICICMTL